jgi:hypothetical protein
MVNTDEQSTESAVLSDAAPPRPGDAVEHGPSGETWVVAYADVERDEIGWLGWPPGCAKLSDCTLKRRGKPGEDLETVRRIWNMKTDNGFSDHRAVAVRRLYPDFAPEDGGDRCE